MQAPQVNGPDADEVRRALIRENLLKNKNAMQRREYFINEQVLMIRGLEIPEDKKKNIELEFVDLMRSNHKMKINRALRKAGEKFHVKFTFVDQI